MPRLTESGRICKKCWTSRCSSKTVSSRLGHQPVMILSGGGGPLESRAQSQEISCAFEGAIGTLFLFKYLIPPKGQFLPSYTPTMIIVPRGH